MAVNKQEREHKFSPEEDFKVTGKQEIGGVIVYTVNHYWLFVSGPADARKLLSNCALTSEIRYQDTGRPGDCFVIRAGNTWDRVEHQSTCIACVSWVNSDRVDDETQTCKQCADEALLSAIPHIKRAPGAERYAA